MSKNDQQLETKKEQPLARPLNVLVPLIKEHLAERKRLRDDSSLWIEIKIGNELLESKSQLKHGYWSSWLEKNFHLSQSTAQAWMKAARKNSAGAVFRTISEASGDRRPHHEAPWSTYVKETARETREQMRQFELDEHHREKEREAEHTLANRLIDIGYKVLSKELHPDKLGGSNEAMTRLNVVRDRLRRAA
jgi:hypothetical protein